MKIADLPLCDICGEPYVDEYVCVVCGVPGCSECIEDDICNDCETDCLTKEEQE